MDETTQINRFILPIHEPTPVGITTYDAKDPDTSFPPITEPRPPAGAPNVLVVLLDDIGFGASSAFGGSGSGQRPAGPGARASPWWVGASRTRSEPPLPGASAMVPGSPISPSWP